MPSAMTLAEIMFAQKKKDRSLTRWYPIRKKLNIWYKKLVINFTKWVKRFFTECIRRRKDIGKLELWTKESVGWYILVKGSKIVHKRHLNQAKNRHIDEENDTPVDGSSFRHIWCTHSSRSSWNKKTKWKRKYTERLDINPKRDRYWLCAE